jgi:chlorite dismutase
MFDVNDSGSLHRAPHTSGSAYIEIMPLDLTPAPRPDEAPAAGLSLAERGKDADGNVILSDRRLYVQLLAFTGATGTGATGTGATGTGATCTVALVAALRQAAFEGVLYEDVNDPAGVALLTFAEDPAHFLDTVRPFVQTGPFGALTFRREMAMLGRTYAIGYEADLDETLLKRPRRTMLNPAWPWAVWYPLRRSGRFEGLPAEEQRRMLMEHGGIGRAYGRAGHAHDVRLACHGLGGEDNDFIAGIVGPTLTGPSAVVQHMRKTQQTSLYLDHLGPFFVGRAVYQSPL